MFALFVLLIAPTLIISLEVATRGGAPGRFRQKMMDPTRITEEQGKLYTGFDAAWSIGFPLFFSMCVAQSIIDAM